MFLAISKLKLLTAENILKSFTYGSYYLKHRVRKIPLGVNYDLVWQFNLSCKHCYFSSSMKELKSSLSEKCKELVQKKLNFIFKYI